MYKLNGAAGRTALINGQEYLFFSGYSYLGMSGVEEFINLVKKAIDIYGLLHPSARISNTQLEIYSTFEQMLSTITGQEKTVSFSSGYLAGRAVAEQFINNKEVIILENTHPVLRDAKESFSGPLSELVEKINSSNKDTFTIISDSVNPLKATVLDYSFLTRISSNKKITCIIDDSHGIGLIGENGKGISSFLPRLTNLDYIITYSLSKAFHINGGAVSGSKEYIEKITRSPFYTGSTAIAPAMVYAFQEGFAIYQRQLKKLQENISFFIELIKDLHFISYHPKLPMFIINKDLNDQFFEKHSIIISSFSYPDPTGLQINRVVLNALHTKDDLQKLSFILHSVT